MDLGKYFRKRKIIGKGSLCKCGSSFFCKIKYLWSYENENLSAGFEF